MKGTISHGFTSYACVLILAAGTTSAAAQAPALRWSTLSLDDASGVPTAVDHSYRFTGVFNPLPQRIAELENNKQIWVSGSGKWDGSHKAATERLQASGAWSGSVAIDYQCNVDPWIYTSQCVRVDIKIGSTGTNSWTPAWDRFSAQQPLTTANNWLAKAEQLSKQHDANASPPPPPTPPVSKPTIQSAARTVDKPKIDAQAAIQSALHPDLSVGGVRVRIENSCDRDQPVAHAHVVVRNVGNAPFPYLTGVYTVHVAETTGKARVDGRVEIGEVKAGQSIGVDVPLNYALAPSDLAGVHRITITLNSLRNPVEKNFANNTDVQTFSFPNGYCSPVKPGAPAISSTARKNSGEIRSLNPQPEPPRPGP